MPDLAAIFARLQPAERQKLLALYQRAQKELAQMALHPTGATTASAQWRANAARQKLQQIDRIVQVLQGRAAAYAARAIPAAAGAGRAMAADQIRRLNRHTTLVLHGRGPAPGGPAGLDANFNVINHDAIRVVAQKMAGDLHQAAASMGESARRILRATSQANLSEADIDQVIAGRLISGDRTLAGRQLRDQLVRAHNGRLVQVVDRNGDTRHYDARVYAEMVVRTQTAQAITNGNLLQYQREGVELVVIDGRQSNNPCSEFLGKVYSIKGDSKDYPPLDSLPGGGPPFHPNCSKGIAAYVPNLATPAQRQAARPEPETAKIAQQWKKQPSDAVRTFNDLQRKAAVKQRMKEINKGTGPKHQVSDSDDPAYHTHLLKEMGVKHVNLGDRSDIGANAVRSIQQTASAGLPMPESIDATLDRFNGDPDRIATTNYASRAIYLNPAAPFWKDPAGFMKREHQAGYLSSADPRHVMFHEQAHNNFATRKLDHQNRRLTTTEFAVASRVSFRAAENADEFIAEVLAGRLAGKRYDSQVMDLYRRLSGQ
ncbi:MAG: hypothetical protein IT447_15460 [Phycisphaerales bacterium]|nr:hypothetical protein [Phycisphaerales bacterium]